ncbi:MAG: hypothetical protein M3Y39_21840 [Chloroflexota bacterium]|nr:hypothetical protein [Chloroflexota bacterium]
MSAEAQVILDLSPDAQRLLDRQGVDLLRELQRELPSLRISYQADPAASAGRKDIVPVIAATAGLITSVAGLVAAVRPIILRILDMISPPDQAVTWSIEERQDGTTIQRLQVFSSKEPGAGPSRSEPPAIDKP